MRAKYIIETFGLLDTFPAYLFTHKHFSVFLMPQFSFVVHMPEQIANLP